MSLALAHILALHRSTQHVLLLRLPLSRIDPLSGRRLRELRRLHHGVDCALERAFDFASDLQIRHLFASVFRSFVVLSRLAHNLKKAFNLFYFWHIFFFNKNIYCSN